MATDLRIGDERDVIASVVDQFGQGAAAENLQWTKDGSNPDVVTLTPDEYECVIEAVEPGEVDVVFTAEAENNATVVEARFPIRVLDASRFRFTFSSPSNLTLGLRTLDGVPYYTLTRTGGSPSTIVVTATPLDAVDDGVHPSAAYAAGLTGIGWARTGAAGAVVDFNGFPTVSGTLVVTLRALSVDSSGSVSRITLTATNSVGVVVQSTFDVLLIAGVTASVELVGEEE